ncbi:hypothetical protein Ddc_10737 [Ditylenchus destructor]|nr:hypothetical protein Ddc_10737 [Ditylenchus destructor]
MKGNLEKFISESDSCGGLSTTKWSVKLSSKHAKSALQEKKERNPERNRRGKKSVRRSIGFLILHLQEEIRGPKSKTCDSSSHLRSLTGIVLFSILDSLKPFFVTRALNNSNPGKGLAEGLSGAIERRFLGLGVWMPVGKQTPPIIVFDETPVSQSINAFEARNCYRNPPLKSHPNYGLYLRVYDNFMEEIKGD